MNQEERKFLRKQIKLIPRKGIVVEIGSWKGGSAVDFSKASKKYGKEIRLYCIDTWDYRKRHNSPKLCKIALKENIYKTFKKNMEDYPHTVLIGKNKLFLKQFDDGSVDVIFLDANHSFDAVKEDICNWLPKLKVGGVFCGHDYGRKEYGVTEAVHEFWDKVENPARSMWKIVVNA